jgi:hypothetical protein
VGAFAFKTSLCSNVLFVVSIGVPSLSFIVQVVQRIWNLL